MSAIVIASTPALRELANRAHEPPPRRAARAPCPSAVMRPPSSRTSRVSASGGGLSQTIHPLTGPGVHERAISRRSDTLGCRQAHARAALFEHRVRHHRGAVEDQLDVPRATAGARAASRTPATPLPRVGRARHLGQRRRLAVDGGQQHVGERPAHVDADQVSPWGPRRWRVVLAGFERQGLASRLGGWGGRQELPAREHRITDAVYDESIDPIFDDLSADNRGTADRSSYRSDLYTG